MIIDLANFKHYSGAFSRVFVDEKNGIAYKLFKSYDHPDFDGSMKQEWGMEKTNEYHKRVFSTELKGYKLVQASVLLKKFTPVFYCQQEVKAVIENGINITHQFLPDCCLKIEFIDAANHMKLNCLMEDTSLLDQVQQNNDFEINQLIQEFHTHGVTYLLDSHVIFDNKKFKIIDFATEDSGIFQPVITTNY